MTEASYPGIVSIVVMGVAGSGKSNVGKAIAARLGGRFIEGDDLHPAANIAKMSRGIPLDDQDRWPWLEAVGRGLSMQSGEDRPAVAACSALKRSYRDVLRATSGMDLLFVLLDGPAELIRARLEGRKGHFMPASLLDSQLQVLERPAADENWMVGDIALPAEAIADNVVGRLRMRHLESGHRPKT